jgi:hypothetical protein
MSQSRRRVQAAPRATDPLDDEVRARLAAGRRRGQRVLRQRVAKALRAPDQGLLERLNDVARWSPERPKSGMVLSHLETLALTLIGAAGQITPEVRAALGEGVRVLATARPGEDTAALVELGLALTTQPEEWRLRLRYCDYMQCDAPYFLARTLNRRARYCCKSHEQKARRGRPGQRELQSRFQQILAVLQPVRRT